MKYLENYLCEKNTDSKFESLAFNTQENLSIHLVK